MIWAMVDGAHMWAGLCWDLRAILGKQQTDKLLRETWFSLKENTPSTDQAVDFRDDFLKRAKMIESGKFVPQLKVAFNGRGL